MTAYVVDFSKSGDELLLDLVNHDNKLSIQPEDVVLVKPPVVLTGNPNFNTQTTIRTTDGDVDVKDVEVNYNRINVDTLFSLVELQIQEVEVDMVDGVLTLNDKVYAEINRKYGTAFSAADFTLSLDPQSRPYLTAKQESVSYLGTREIRLINSLASRVSNVTLSGYHAQPMNEVYILVPNDMYPARSYFTGSTEFDNPANQFGGEWEKVNSVILDETQHHFYGYAVGLGTYLSTDAVLPESAHYSFVRRADDAVYNKDKAITVTMANGSKGIEITEEGSPLKGQQFQFDPEPVGFKTYMMIRKDAGEVSSTAAPKHVWKRIG